MENLINKHPICASNIYGKTNENKMISFSFVASKTGEYKVYCCEAESVTILDSDENVLISSNNFKVSLCANEVYYLQIKTIKPCGDFSLNFYNINDKVVYPYELNIENNGKNIPLRSNSATDPLIPALIEMKKRPGGHYIYSNVPESMPLEAVNTILMENKELSGECFLTFEHQNTTGLPYVYIGYRLVNNNPFDVYVTVKNVGYQVNGSWLGEKSWMDYYGVKYDMNADSFDEKALDWFKAYLNFDTLYEPKAIVPTTYRIPSGKYIYVIGGTSDDAFNKVNVNNTANLKITPHNCANGNILFDVLNGNVTGELCVYDDIEKLNKDRIVQNFRKYHENDDMGGRIGISHHRGVIDDNPIWIFNDNSKSGYLPVKYYPLYADSLKDKYVPFEKIEGSYKHEYVGTSWYSHLSSQLHHEYVGHDMIENITYYKGQEILLSTNIANPAGNIWDFGNWMIEYHENCVFVNQGDKDRKVRFYLENSGSLFCIFKDENENLLHATATLITCTGRKPIYEHTIPAHSRVLISMQVVLAANNCGSVEHIVELV